MTELSVLERMRAAVAEVGYDPSLILDPTSYGGPDLATYGTVPGIIPEELLWRARETAAAPVPICWACYKMGGQAHHGGAPPPCGAGRRFVQDCGRDRGEK